MLSKEDRIANLKRASAMTRVQDAQIQNALNGMSNEQVEMFIDNNPEVAEMLAVGSEQSNPGIVVNYKSQPKHQKEKDISISPPWEANFAAAAQPQGRVNLFQVGSEPTAGMSFNNNNYGFYNSGMNQNDERVKRFTPGMSLYGLNPYNFFNADQMVNYYNALEKQREFNTNQQYGWVLICAKFSGSQEMYDYAETLKFKPADQIYQEQQEARAKAEEERRKALMGDNEDNDIIYDVYDARGVRYQRAFDFCIIDVKTGKVEMEVKHKKDKSGQSYTVHTQVEDRKKQYEIQETYAKISWFERYRETFRRLFNKAYTDNLERWQRWKDEGLSVEEGYIRMEDERIDWKRHEKMLQRALRAAAFSKDTFNKILSSCCNTDLNYANRSDFFSLSYDFERDLHYKSLVSTPEEMNMDPLVHQKLQEEYDIKRRMFMNKVESGDLGCQMATDAHYHPTFAKTPVDELTLEDYKKPENQFMYTKTVTPDIATKNLFIPPELSGDDDGMTKEKLAAMGVHFDENGQIIPQQRTMGRMTVDDDTGEILSQEEFDVTPPSGAHASDSMSDAELMNLF